METMKNTFIKNMKNKISDFEIARKEYIYLKILDNKLQAIDKEVKIEVLKENIFIINGSPFEEENGKRLINPGNDYNLNDDDFIKYCKLVHEKRIKYPIVKVDNWEFTTNKETVYKLFDAKDNFLEIIYKTLPNNLKPQIKKVIDGHNNDLKEKLIKIGLELNTKELKRC